MVAHRAAMITEFVYIYIKVLYELVSVAGAELRRRPKRSSARYPRRILSRQREGKAEDEQEDDGDEGDENGSDNVQSPGNSPRLDT